MFRMCMAPRMLFPSTTSSLRWGVLRVRQRTRGGLMFFHVQKLINEIVPDEPDPAAANALQEGLGGQFSEMRTMMQYCFRASTRGATRNHTKI